MATFEQGQINASKLTEKEMALQWNKVLDSYDKAISDINAEIVKLHGKMPSFTDAQKKEGAMLRWSQKRARLDSLLKSTKEAFNKSAAKAGGHIAKSSEIGITNTYYREQYTLSFFTEGDLPFTFIDTNVVESSVFGSQEAWSKIDPKVYGNPQQYITQGGTLTDLLRRDRNATLLQIQQSITSGLIQGKSAAEMGKDIEGIIGLDTPKGYTGLKAKSARIARTEGIRNLNSGYAASQNEAASLGIEQKKRWIVTLDDRHGDRDHGKFDGQERELSKDFNINSSTGPFPGQMNEVGENVNCRCTTISIIPGLEPEQRTAKNAEGKSEIFTYKNYPEWASENGLKQNPSGLMVKKA